MNTNILIKQTRKAKRKRDILKSADKTMFRMLILFALSHFIFLILFELAGIKEMYYYNYFSVAFFTTLAFSMLSNKISLLRLDILVTLELIVHQVLAIYFVGTEPGFQYIFFGMAAPLIGYNMNKQHKLLSVTKATISLMLFLGASFLTRFGIQPVYQNVEPKYIITFKLYIICIAFYTIAWASLDTYIKYTERIAQEYNLYKEEANKQVQMQRGIVDVVANIIEARDEDTGQHTERTSKYVGEILKGLKSSPKYESILTDEYIDKVVSAATLHDIGKIKISDAILNKPGKLTPEEYEVIKTHTIEGRKILDKCDNIITDKEYLKIAKDIAFYHHERVDGKGYPTQISGDNIPFSARVMAIADVYDALTNKRVYKEKYDKEVSINILKEGRGTQFDSEILDVFLDYIKNESK